MDDLGWPIVGVALLVVACAIAGWGALELREPPPKPVIPAPEAPAPPAPKAEIPPADVDRFFAAAYPVSCPIDADAAASPGGAYRLDPAGVNPALVAVAEAVSHDASIDRGKLVFVAPPGATRATVQLDGYGEIEATWNAPSDARPDGPPVPCAARTVARAVTVWGRVLDPRGSDVSADCAIRRAHVEDSPASYRMDLPSGRSCSLQLLATDGRPLGRPHGVTASADTRLDLP